MPRQQESAVGAPFAKLVNLGDSLVGAWGGALRKQQRDYDTGDPKWKDTLDDNGQRVAMLEEVNWFVAMPGTSASTGNADDGYEQIEPGDIVRFSFSGFKWHNVIEARKALPAVPEQGIKKKGKEASSDVYTITLSGWSKETKNAEGARKAGFTVVEGRIIVTTDEEADKLISHLRKQGGNINLAKDLTIEVRRNDFADEQEWADAADDLWDSEPWKQRAADDNGSSGSSDGDPGPSDPGEDYDEEPF